VLRVTEIGGVTRFDLARTILGRGHYWTTVYLVDDVLIDSGCAHCAPELARELSGVSLRRIVNTHTHEDHIGANARLVCDHPEVGIRAHPLALRVLADPRGTQPLHPYRRLMWGWPEPSEAESLAEGDVVATGRRKLEVVYTPGHSRDHLCLFARRDGWLFSGDLYVGGRDRALRAGYDVWGILASLRKVSALPIETLFPGSARVPADPSIAIRSKIEHLERLGERVLALDAEGRSVKEIARALCGGPMPMEMFTLGHFSRRRLVLSYLRRNHDSKDPHAPPGGVSPNQARPSRG
jgi:glyoxylase-like metal-dependent hydrolase (beta-lactamase superfamily II)